MTYHPFEIFGASRQSRFFITCDHAANTVPTAIGGGDLGIAAEDMARHIAYDVGARGLSIALGEVLDAPVICSNFSRLVIDPNRGEDDPTLIMQLYDGTIIPTNRHVDEAERERRLDLCYRPYHAALANALAAREDPVIISIHSFTPQLRGKPFRPWQVGILSAHDRRLGDVLIAQLSKHDDLCVGDNEPYNGALEGDAIDKHALQHNRHNTLIEVRNDLISEEKDQIAWAKRLAPDLIASLDILEQR